MDEDSVVPLESGSCYKSFFLGLLWLLFNKENKGKKTKMIHNPLLR